MDSPYATHATLSETMVSALKVNNKYIANGDEYIAWHIRTADGETSRSYNPNIHKYIVTEESSSVCPSYVETTSHEEQKCTTLKDLPIFISSTR